jgi:Zn-dependent protease with chaperone function
MKRWRWNNESWRLYGGWMYTSNQSGSGEAWVPQPEGANPLLLRTGSVVRRRLWLRSRRWIGSQEPTPGPSMDNIVRELTKLNFQVLPAQHAALAEGGCDTIDEAIELLSEQTLIEETAEHRLITRGQFVHDVQHDVRHPLDLYFFHGLTNIPLMKGLLQLVMQYYLEGQHIAMTGSMLMVGPSQMPHVYEVFQKACNALGVPPESQPRLYVENDPRINAYTMANTMENQFVVLTSGLLNVMDDAEMQFVIGHELGHIICEHGVYNTMAEMIAGHMFSGASELLLLPVQAFIFRWHQTSELSADRVGLLAVGNPMTAFTALMQLNAGVKAEGLDVDAFLRQADRHDELSAKSPLLALSLKWDLSHGFTTTRVKELQKWSRSPEYRKLLTRNTKLA